MRILVFGGSGMLGHKLVQRLSDRFEVWATLQGEFSKVDGYGLFSRERTLENVNVTDPSQVRRAIETSQPDVVVNAAGIIKQVAAAEDVVQLLTVNSIFPRRLADLSAQRGFRLIAISTDCVFSGDRGSYVESDPADAGDLYGISKYLGEVTAGNCLTIRTSIIGRELGTSNSIVEWFLSNRGKTVNGYVNAIYSGFPTIVLADIIAGLIADHPDLNGLYHVSSEPISKFELLNLLNRSFGTATEIIPSADYAIDRSLDSTRFREAAGFEPAAWETMVDRLASDPTPYEDWKQLAAEV